MACIYKTVVTKGVDVKRIGGLPTVSATPHRTTPSRRQKGHFKETSLSNIYKIVALDIVLNNECLNNLIFWITANICR